MMTREELIRRHFDHNSVLLEFGPSYRPIAPKSDGWRTIVVDHASQTDLIAKYAARGIEGADRIESVDFIWQGSQLTTLIPREMHGTFDGLIASHVGEHLPDLITFFQDASALLKSDGLMALALPDKRVCFDFFQPLTTTGDLLAARTERRVRHSRRNFFNQAAYFVTRNGEGGWAHIEQIAPFHLNNSLWHAQHEYEAANENPASEYRDTHAWTFTPKSFELLILELNLLGQIDWTIRAIEPALGVEFYVWLERRRIIMPEHEINQLRLSLLAAIVRETQDSIAQLGAPPIPPPARQQSSTGIPVRDGAPSIAVVIPLFNGSRYIEEAILSVCRQTLLPSEVVVVNDGSTDASREIVERLAKIHPITLLNIPNRGQSVARNAGVRASRSGLIAFLDQDDTWYKTHLEELVQPFLVPSDPPLGWVYSNVDEIDQDGNLVCRSFLNLMPALHPKKHLSDCLRENMFVVPSASLVSREAFEEAGAFDERLCGYEDDDLFMRIFRRGYDNVYINRALSQWRIYPKSTSYTPRFAESRFSYCQKLLNMFPDQKQLGRYYTRDMIVPRFLPEAVRDYEATLPSGMDEDSAWAQVEFLAKHCDRVPPTITEHALNRYDRALLLGDPLRIEAIREQLRSLFVGNDFMIRRMVGQGLAHYKFVLSRGDNRAITIIWNEVFQLISREPKMRAKLGRTLSVLRNPSISRIAFEFRHVLRPVMLWAFQY